MRRRSFTAQALLTMLMSACYSAPDTDRYNSAEQPDAVPQQEWRSYLAGSDFSHYSLLEQIHRGNVSQLEVAWRYQAGGAGDNGTTQMQCNPLVVKGILYGSSPTLHVFALNAATGEELWRFDPDADDDRFLPNPNRGLVYWEQRDEQRLLFTAGSFLYALNARSGGLIQSFGDDGAVDLHEGLPKWAQDAAVVATTPGSIYNDLLILGSRVSEFKGAAPGHIHAFDVHSGELRWIFHTIPQAGEFGVDTWPEASRKAVGGANSWAGIAVDQERGIAFAPTGSATFDFYGADRAGDNLFANSLLALDASTGKRLWHFQFVRHDLWDRDLPLPPNLITLQRDGAAIPAVAQATKTGHVFVFHRETGKLLFPVEEVTVVGDGLRGEHSAKTQPLPLSPPPFTEQNFRPTNRNPEMIAEVIAHTKLLDSHASFRVPSLNGTIVYPGIDGGAEWGGAAYDANLNRLYVNANEVPYLLNMAAVERDLEMGPKFAYLMVCAGCHGADMKGDGLGVPSLQNLSDRLSPLQAYRVVKQGRGRMPAFDAMTWYEIAAVLWHVYQGDDDGDKVTGVGEDTTTGSEGANYINAGYQKFLDPDGFPASKPPWGSLTAIDLDTATIAWRIPFGDYPKLLEKGVSGLGSENYGGPIITASGLLFIAATPDRKFKAYDSRNGELLWSSDLPAAGFATPASYAVNGRQYVVIAAGGGKLGEPSGSEYIAYALPK